MITLEGIRAAGLHLLGVLAARKTVRYSSFYNKDAVSGKLLATGAFPHVKDTEACCPTDLEEEGHVMLEHAAWQLEDLGVVRITWLKQPLIDGEPDYRIQLTNRRKLAWDFSFRGPHYSIPTAPAVAWIVASLSPGRKHFTLRKIMKLAADNNDVFEDDFGNKYRYGTLTFTSAFEATLWHFARAGLVEPREFDSQRRFWRSRIEVPIVRPHGKIEGHTLSSLRFIRGPKYGDGTYVWGLADQVKYIEFRSSFPKRFTASEINRLGKCKRELATRSEPDMECPLDHPFRYGFRSGLRPSWIRIAESIQTRIAVDSSIPA